VRIDARPDCAHRVFDPAVPARCEHSGHDHDLMMLGNLPQLLGPGSVQRFSNLGQRQSETAHGGLGKDHQLRATPSCRRRLRCHQFQVFLGV
jgi:hypothetical protein